MGRGKRNPRATTSPIQTSSAPWGSRVLPKDVRPAPPGVEQRVVFANGTHCWYVDGVLHRDGGPALERPDGYRKWYRNGKKHREDGPAVEQPDGLHRWYRDGLLHREDGPALMSWSADDKWFLHGEPQPTPEAPAIVQPGALNRRSPLAAP